MENIRKKNLSNKIGKIVTRYPFLAVIAVFIILFSIFSIINRLFASSQNWGGIVSLASETGILALGVTFLMISGEFDISIGSNFALCAAVFGGLLAIKGFPQFLAFIIAIIIGAIIGLLNGVITLKIKIPSFIATLGTMMIWRGLVYYITGNQNYVRYTGKETILLKIMSVNFFGQFKVNVFWLLIIFLILQFILFHTKYGNYVFAVGGNIEAAAAMGVNTSLVKIMNFTLVGLLAGIAGCLSFSHIHIVDPLMGKGLELRTIAAAVIGGTLLYGGYGNLIGTIFGLVVVSMIGSFLVMVGVNVFWLDSIIGLLLILAVILNTKIKMLERL